MRTSTPRTPKNTLCVVASQNGKAHGPKKPQRPTSLPATVPLGRVSASLEGRAPRRVSSTSLEDLTPPRAILRLARGPDAPSGDSLPCSRLPQARDAAGARVKGESPPCRPSDTAWESYLGVVPPTRPVWPSLALCG
jgi:hypothetical protein